MASSNDAPVDGTSIIGATIITQPTSTSTTALSPNDIPITLQYINDTSWPSNLNLDIELSNWDEWSFQVSLLAD